MELVNNAYLRHQVGKAKFSPSSAVMQFQRDSQPFEKEPSTKTPPHKYICDTRTSDSSLRRPR